MQCLPLQFVLQVLEFLLSLDDDPLQTVQHLMQGGDLIRILTMQVTDSIAVFVLESLSDLITVVQLHLHWNLHNSDLRSDLFLINGSCLALQHCQCLEDLLIILGNWVFLLIWAFFLHLVWNLDHYFSVRTILIGLYFNLGVMHWVKRDDEDLFIHIVLSLLVILERSTHGRRVYILNGLTTGLSFGRVDAICL